MTFGQPVTYRKKHYRASSAKQDAARSRNWYIKKLRAYFHLCPIREGERGKQIQKLIDAEIVSMGAESEVKRHEARIEVWHKQLQDNSQLMGQEFDFPEFKTSH